MDINLINASLYIFENTLSLEKEAAMRSNVETRKLHFIEELLKVDNEDIINKLEALLKIERFKTIEKELGQPLTMSDFNDMIDRAEDDLKEGKFISSKELKKKVQNWK